METWICIANLRQIQQTSTSNANSPKVNINDTVLVYDEKVSILFWRSVIVTGVLPSRDSQIRKGIVRIAKANTILKRSVNYFLTVGNRYHDTKQTNKAREQKLRREVGEWTKEKIWMLTSWALGGGGVFEHYKY